MTNNSSRRDFLTAGLALPATSFASVAQRPSTQRSQPQSSAGPKVQYRTLGKTGLKVTTMGFGCMITSDPTVIEKAADLGINWFDTARVYQGGNNERMVGAALKSRRDKVYISSKTQGQTQDAALKDLDTSLKELQTDHIDVWYLHNKRVPTDIKDELMEAQNIAKKAGKIRFAGISNHLGHAELLPAVIKARHFDVLLTSYNFAMDRNAGPLIDQVRAAGIGVVAMKIMAGGFRRAPFYPSDDKTRGTLKQEGAMLAALKWVMNNRNVDTTVPSITDQDQLDEDIRSMAAPFSPADEKLLNAQLEYIRPLYCRMCGQCTGACPKDLPVADMLRFLMYAEGYGQFALGREHFLTLPEGVREVRCTSCSTCSIHCPNGVQVSDRLIRAQELFA